MQEFVLGNYRMDLYIQTGQSKNNTASLELMKGYFVGFFLNHRRANDSLNLNLLLTGNWDKEGYGLTQYY